MSSYIIGVDGGGTKTVAVLWDYNGNEIKRFVSGFANFSISKEETIKNIEDAISNVKGNHEISYIVLGIAGRINNNLRLEVEKHLNKMFNTTTKLITDGYLALNSVGYDLDATMIIIGGTGSVVYAKNKEEIVSIGGFGHILGDEGSAYHLVLETFRYMINDIQSNLEVSNFTKEMFEALNIKEIDEVKDFIYSKSKDVAASKAIFVSNLAKKGNEVAIKLLTTEGESLGLQAVLALKKLGINEVTIELKGSFLLNAPYVKENFLEVLKNNKIKFNISENNNEPVIGAFNLAKKIIQKERKLNF